MKSSQNSTRTKGNLNAQGQQAAGHHKNVRQRVDPEALRGEAAGGKKTESRARKRPKIDREQEAKEWLARHTNPKRLAECHHYSQGFGEQEGEADTTQMACERMVAPFDPTSVPMAPCVVVPESIHGTDGETLRFEWQLPRGIKAIPEHERPREKLLTKGAGTLNDAELLALLIGSGTHAMSALDLAQRMLNDCGGLGQLGRLQARDLQEIGGIGAAKASQIVAGFELARRQQAAFKKVLSFHTPREVAEYVRNSLAHLPNEVFKVILFNAANNVLAERDLFVGGFNGTIVDSRVIYKFALQHHSTKVVLCHNHPSGDCRPSEADLTTTETVAIAGHTLGIRVIDHIIVTSWGYYSFADNGLIGKIEKDIKIGRDLFAERSILRHYSEADPPVKREFQKIGTKP